MAGLSAYERMAVLEVLHYRWPGRRTPRGSLFAWLFGNICSWQASKLRLDACLYFRHKGARPMTLAHLIHQLVTNPEQRLAFESGTLRLEGAGLSPLELAATTEVMSYRSLRRAKKRSLFDEIFTNFKCWET
jgi:hypothetical protein